MNKIIIGLSGLIGSGKNTVAEMLSEYHNFKPVAFADALKDVCSAIFQWPREMLEGNSQDSRYWRDQVDTWWAQKLGIPHFTPRYALQNVGTNLFREHFHTDIWVLTVERIIESQEHSNIVVTDCRFFNELDIIKKHGGTTWRVLRGDQPGWASTAAIANLSGNSLTRESAVAALTAQGVHPSEYGAFGYSFDKTINNDSSLEDLRKTVVNAIGGYI